MSDLPRSVLRTYRLDWVLAYMLPRVLAALPWVDQAVSYLQEDYWSYGFKEGLPVEHMITGGSLLLMLSCLCLLSMSQMHCYLAVKTS